jgi:ribonuclease R
VQGPSLKKAFGGDKVLVKLKPVRPGARREGEIIKVLSRARSTLVGEFQKVKGKPCLVPQNGESPAEILNLHGKHPAEGDMVVLRVTRWPDGAQPAAGDLAEVLGRRNVPAVDVKMVLRQFELADEFPRDVEAQARAFGDRVPADALKGRETFFDLPVFTIDGADAKDFDDAVSLESRPGGGWRLGVHIADVSHYVAEGSPLDREAQARGTSVYLSGAVRPMLPFPLSDNLCSLRPHVIRLTLTCLMELDAEGHMTTHRVVESAIKSARRFTYDEVEEVLAGKGVDAPAAVLRDVKKMGELAQILRRNRQKRGSLDFDFPEPYIVTDDTGWPVDVRRRERGDSHRLIEEFMLLANEAVARGMKDVPFLYRIHPAPDPAKMKALEASLRAVGVAPPRDLHDGRPAALQSVMAQVKGQTTEALVHMMILRSLKQAVYSPANAGHFGLASHAYTHFTSPIRRYPDLLVHRLVRERLQGKLSPARQTAWKAALGPLTEQASGQERKAVEAERDLLALRRAQVMGKRLGETFDGVVTGVTAFGVFVQLTEIFVEGLLHISALRDDHYIYDEVRAQLRGRRTGKRYHMGQKVRVRLAAANTLKRQLDFELAK